MKILDVSFIDDLDDIKIYAFNVEVDNQGYIEIAKNIDGEDYLESCFRIVLIYETETNKINTPELEYIDNNGNVTEMQLIKDVEILDEIYKKIKEDN